MNKHSRFLAALFSLLLAAGGCRPKDATQTVVEVRPDPTMRERVTTVQVDAYALRPDVDDVLVERFPPEEVSWPVRRTFTPSSATSSHRFRMVVHAFDATQAPVASLSFEGDVVEGVTRYVLVRLGDTCSPAKCQADICEARVNAADLGNAQQEAFCGAAHDEPGNAATSGENVGMTMTGTPGAGTPGMMGAAPASGSSPGTAADGGTAMQTSAQSTQDAGVSVPPPPRSTVGVCEGVTCADHGYCSPMPDAASKFVCVCDKGFEPDENATSCVVRDDCKKDNGGCEGTCETVSDTGEAKCSCAGNTWLKGDGKGCAELQPELVLTNGSGSVQRTRPQVAFDSAGNGVVVWAETSDDGNHTLWTARYSADTKSWQKPTRPFLPYTTNAADLHLALDANGSGLLIWTATVGSYRQLWVARYSNNAFSGAQRVDDSDSSNALMPAFAVDSMGDGLIAWTDSAWPKSSLRVARYYASSNMVERMTSSVGSSGESLVFNTSVALHTLESGLIAWTDVPVSTPDGGVAVHFDESAAFNVKVGLDIGPGLGFGDSRTVSTSPDVAMDAAGHGVAVWLRANGTANRYTLLSGDYVSGAGWDARTAEALADDVSVASAPNIAVGPDGSALAVWRETLGSDTAAKSMTRGALRLTMGAKFESPQDLGLPSDPAFWTEGDGMTWTVENMVSGLEQLQPQWDLTAGPQHNGFVVGAAFDSSMMPIRRELWLQRVAADQPAARPIRFTPPDSVPAMPSAPRIGMNEHGDGAVVWDRQVDGHYQVVVSLLE